MLNWTDIANPKNDNKEALNLQILACNLQHIVTQKIGRLNGRCLMHEVLLQNNFVVFDFCTQVHESWSILNDLAGHTLSTTILNVVDDDVFAVMEKTTEARRFFQYWSKVEKSAFLHNGGAPA